MEEKETQTEKENLTELSNESSLDSEKESSLKEKDEDWVKPSNDSLDAKRKKWLFSI